MSEELVVNKELVQEDVVFIIYQASQKIIFLGLVFYQFGSYPLKLIHLVFLFSEHEI